MKKNTIKITFKLLTFVVLSLIFIGCSNKEDNELTILTLDINPSIELVINKEGNIDSINAVNDDAKNVLKDIDVINDSLDEGVSEIIEEAIEKGYITNLKENNILISIDGATVDETISIRNTTKNAIDKTLDEKAIPVNIAIQEIDVTNEMISKAMQDEISVGKLYAIEKINESGVAKIENSKNALISDIINFGSQAQIFNDDKDDVNYDINDNKKVSQPNNTSVKPNAQRYIPVNNDDNDNDDNNDNDD